MDTADIQERLREVDCAKIFATDLNGRLVALQVNPDRVTGFFERGVGFDGSSIAGISTVDDSDRLLVPVPESFRFVECRDEKLGFFIGRINAERGTRSPSDPRAVLERVAAAAAAEFGFRFLMGPEHEFFLLKGDRFSEDMHSDQAGYLHAAPRDRGETVRKTIVEVLRRCGIRFEKTHHEVTASQHEINLEPVDPLAAADRTVLFNYVTQRVAQEHGFHASFMPKPFDGQNRNAFHIHLSMWDEADNNLFYEAGAPHDLSPLARQFVGGILKYARQTSIIMASTFNSYKAYVRDREVPVVRGWGMRNRSSMVRVPYTDSPPNTRIELRTPDPAGNVYLQMAVLIGMGLQGVREGLDCGLPDAGVSYRRNRRERVWDRRFVPKCMFEALVEAQRSAFLKTFLGEPIYEGYMALKVADWEEHRTHVTAREYRKYLSM